MRVHCLAILLCIGAFFGSDDASAAGDPQRGREIATACSACHGLDGSSPSPAFPILGGQHQEYLVQAMLAYQSGTRAASIMGGAIRTLSRQQIEDVAAHFSAQTALVATRSGQAVDQAASPPAATNLTAQASTSGAAAALADIAAPPPAADAPPEAAGCPAGGSETRDADRDGLADAFDAAPEDAGEFVRDADGDGWFDICSIRQLQAIQSLGTGRGQKTTLALAERNTRRYELVRDLDAAGIGNFEPIGNCGAENNCMVARDKYGFAGALDGNGHVIRNLLITRPDTGGVGLFGTLARTGVVRNLRLENATVTGLHGTGALVGANFGLVADCTAQVKVSGRLATGGLVGGNAGQVSNCQVSGEVTAEAAVGGLAGDMNGSVVDSAADMRVSAGKSAGGLVGLNTTGEVRNSHAAGSITAGDNTGGLVGVNTDGLVGNSYATTTVVSSGTNVGGLVGFNSQSRIDNSYATGPVTGKAAVGALTGRNNGSLRNVRATGSVTLAQVNTVQPFARGDILVAATIMDNPTDDHGGTGRIIQYDENLKVKGELYLEGTRHKIGGLAFAPDRTLWAFSQLTPAIAEIGPDGVQKPMRSFSDRKLSSVTFGRDGSLYFGEHMMGKATGHPAVTTKFSLLPGRDVIGDGHVFRYSNDGKLLREYKTEANGGLFGFLAVTSTVLADNDTRMIYISETGRRVMQYDLANDRQLPDLADFSNDPDVPMVLVMNPMPDGRLLISTGKGFLLADARSGQVLRHYPLAGMGWAAVNSSADGQYALIGNFFTGDIVKVRLADGEVVARNNIGQKESLSGIAQFPG
ncbi:MAG: GLUG motif-containing protein [Gammaproteobacteria bacterium]